MGRHKGRTRWWTCTPRVYDRPMKVRALTGDDLDAFLALRKKALTLAPSAFGSSPGEDISDDPARALASLRDPPEVGVTFGGFDAEALVGLATLRVSQRRKTRHQAAVYGMYVAPSARRAGLGRALLEALVAHGRSLDLAVLGLSVSEDAVAARRLYESIGFVTWGVEPAGLCVDGTFLDVRHMQLDLRTSD